MPTLNPSAAGERAISDYDTNHDGGIAGEELNHSPGLKAAMSGVDKDHDGRLTAEEISGRIAAYKATGLALMTANCQVTLNGAPLANAEVTLVPEPFMGPAVKTARATTDATGGGSFQIEGETIRGANCGIYRVTVSKKDASGKETIPAKYNVNTTLGVDLGPGGASAESGLALKLKSP